MPLTAAERQARRRERQLWREQELLTALARIQQARSLHEARAIAYYAYTQATLSEKKPAKPAHRARSGAPMGIRSFPISGIEPPD